MSLKNTAATYTRSPETRGQQMAYEQKFASLIQLCREAQSKGIDVIMVAYPWVIGDDYEEMARSLTLIAEANLLLCITAGNADSGKYTRN